MRKETALSFVASLAFAFLSVVSASAEDKLKNVEYNPSARYSQLIIDSRINDFYANKKLMGFNVYDTNGKLLKNNAGGSNLKYDYVPGLVAKAIIETVEYYSNEPWAKPWFYSIQDYANTYIGSVPTTGGSLDDLNATKMYFTLANISAPNQGSLSAISAPETYDNAHKAMECAAKGLKDTQETYVIKASTNKENAGGWWHKKSYPNQMWCDGQYMGPALLAQLTTMGHHIGTLEQDWQTIVLQFDLCWKNLWDKDKELLWHAFSASPTDQYAKTWADAKTLHSQEYWGRACGWFFLALVDVLELMPEGADRTRLMQYLDATAAGLAKRQDAATGCWYQLLAHDGTFCATKYNGKTYSPTYNYLESSASALFTAAYLKGMRLGLLSSEKYAKVAEKAYKGLITEFLKQKEDGSYTLVNCCASAGLGGSSYRDGSAEYYLLGSDVTRVTSYTEGKVFGAFILASLEWERRSQSSAISAVSTRHQESKALYSISGQRISEPQNGSIYLAGGRKLIAAK